MTPHVLCNSTFAAVMFDMRQMQGCAHTCKEHGMQCVDGCCELFHCGLSHAYNVCHCWHQLTTTVHNTLGPSGQSVHNYWLHGSGAISPLCPVVPNRGLTRRYCTCTKHFCSSPFVAVCEPRPAAPSCDSQAVSLLIAVRPEGRPKVLDHAVNGVPAG